VKNIFNAIPNRTFLELCERTSCLYEAHDINNGNTSRTSISVELFMSLQNGNFDTFIDISHGENEEDEIN
jgi:hypothetical protein